MIYKIQYKNNLQQVFILLFAKLQRFMSIPIRFYKTNRPELSITQLSQTQINQVKYSSKNSSSSQHFSSQHQQSNQVTQVYQQGRINVNKSETINISGDIYHYDSDSQQNYRKEMQLTHNHQSFNNSGSKNHQQNRIINQSSRQKGNQIQEINKAFQEMNINQNVYQTQKVSSKPVNESILQQQNVFQSQQPGKKKNKMTSNKNKQKTIRSLLVIAGDYFQNDQNRNKARQNKRDKPKVKQNLPPFLIPCDSPTIEQPNNSSQTSKDNKITENSHPDKTKKHGVIIKRPHNIDYKNRRGQLTRKKVKIDKQINPQDESIIQNQNQTLSPQNKKESNQKFKKTNKPKQIKGYCNCKGLIQLQCSKANCQCFKQGRNCTPKCYCDKCNFPTIQKIEQMRRQNQANVSSNPVNNYRYLNPQNQGQYKQASSQSDKNSRVSSSIKCQQMHFFQIEDNMDQQNMDQQMFEQQYMDQLYLQEVIDQNDIEKIESEQQKEQK